MDLKFTTKAELNDFLENVFLTEDEEKIIRTRQLGWSREKQAQAINRSLSGVDKLIAKIKAKKEIYDNESKKVK